MTVANVFHAGDGNLHPIILFDERKEEELRGALAISREILEVCVEAGGTLSGEHGIGLEKMDVMELVYTSRDLDAMRKVKQAFDPEGLCNPGKILPDGKGVKMPLLRVPASLRGVSRR